MIKRQTKAAQRAREIILDCMNVVERQGDSYVAIHKDSDGECIVIASILKTFPIISIIVGDRLLFSEAHAEDLYRDTNELNRQSLFGWHTLHFVGDTTIYLYRQSLWIRNGLDREEFMEVLCHCISEYKSGRAELSAGKTEQ